MTLLYVPAGCPRDPVNFGSVGPMVVIDQFDFNAPSLDPLGVYNGIGNNIHKFKIFCQKQHTLIKVFEQQSPVGPYLH